MNETKVISGVPIPTGYKSKWADTQRRMQIGDCVDVDSTKEAHGMRMALMNNGFKAVMRKQEDGKIRIWKAAKANGATP